MELHHGSDLAFGAKADSGAKISVIGGSGQQIRTGSGQQAATERELFGAMTVGQEAVIAKALETRGQAVLEEEANEFLSRHGHHLAERVAVVGPPKGDLAVIERQQALVADGDTVSIASEVLQHLGGAAEGRLGINHPFFLSEGSQELGEGAGIAQRFQRSEKL